MLVGQLEWPLEAINYQLAGFYQPPPVSVLAKADVGREIEMTISASAADTHAPVTHSLTHPERTFSLRIFCALEPSVLLVAAAEKSSDKRALFFLPLRFATKNKQSKAQRRL